MAIHFAMYLSFVLSKLEERADGEKLRNAGIHISFYMRLTYWDIVGIDFFIIATIAVIGMFRYFRFKEPEKLNSLDLRNH